MEQDTEESKKKALIVTTVSGFVPQFEMGNVRLLQELGYEVHYASNFSNVSYGMDNRRLDGTGIICHQIDFERSPFRVRENMRAYRQLKHLLAGQHFELLHCHTPVGAALARLAAASHRKKGTKVVYTAHGFHFYKGAPLKYWLLFYPAERLLANLTDVLVTMNREDYLRARRFCRRKKTKVKYIPGVGVDTAYFGGVDLSEGGRECIRQAVRKEFGISEGETVFLSVGELIPRKNHAAVIRAFTEITSEKARQKRVREFRYFICGQGALERELQKQIKDAGLFGKVQLLGYRKDIRELLYAADIFVFPSLQEGMPVALMEAAAAGIPAIASDIRGNRDLETVLGSGSYFRDMKELKQKVRENMETIVQGSRVREGKAVPQDGEKIRAVKTFDRRETGRRMRKIYGELSQ